jgi:hypothetical protein
VLAAVFVVPIRGSRGKWPVPTGLAAIAAVAVVVTIVLPLPRHVGDVTADVHVDKLSDTRARIEVALDPPDAADEARWFQASAWQGGGLVVSDFEEVAPGRYVTEGTVPIGDGWKTIVRLHRGGELMTVPIFLPADPAIDEPEIPAVDRTAPFESETLYLLRETHPGTEWFKYLIYGLLVLACVVWATAFAIAVRGVGRDRGRSGRRQDRDPGTYVTVGYPGTSRDAT